MKESPTSSCQDLVRKGRRLLWRGALVPIGLVVLVDLGSASVNGRSLYDRLHELSFDAKRVAEVRNLRLQRHEIDILFEEGKFYLSKPVGGRVTGAVFVGQGRLRFVPPNELERQQVHRFMEKDTLDEAFTEAYLRFTDDTADTLLSKLTWEPGSVPDRVRELHRWHSKALLERRGWNLTSRILEGVLAEHPDKFFLAAFKAAEYEFNYPPWYYVVVDPTARESVGVMQHFAFRIKKPFYVLSSYRPQDADRRYGTYRDALRISHYVMEVDLTRPKALDATVTMRVVPEVSGLRLLRFDLNEEAEVDSAWNARGDTLPVFQEEDEAGFAVLLPTATRAGVAETLSVHYRGKLLRQNATGHYHLKDREKWYPRVGYLQRSTFDMTFLYPKKYDLVSVGVQDTAYTENGRKIARWRQTLPAKVVAFNLGTFEVTEFSAKGIPKIKVYSGGLRRESMRKKIAGDVGNSLYLYGALLAPYPYQEIRVAEAAGIVSQGFPGLLYLSGLTYETELEGVMEGLRSHEVSHQWWGNLVGWRTYHDQWLSEALAQYCGALYVEMSLAKRERFLQLLKAWRDDILERGNVGVSAGLRRFGFSKRDLARSEGPKAGPIWMGVRLGQREGVDYYVTVYEKGAYVIHMLRTMLRDYETASDQKFWAMLRDFANRYSMQDPTTQDFQRIAEQYYGESLDWFFEQWVYGTETPSLLVRKETVEDPPGKFTLRFEVQQEDVTEPFRMLVPITVEFPSGLRRTFPQMLDQWSQALTLGPFDERPLKVIFNDMGGVLARVRER
jgi:hypothetical protein